MPCHSEWHAMSLSFSHPIISMCSFSLSSLHQLEWLAHLQQSPVPLQFPLPDVVIATHATPTHSAFYFQGSGLPWSVSGAWSGSLCRAHIALQELQAVAIMLCMMAFCLLGWITGLLRLTCVMRVVQCLLFFPGWPARYWVWLTSMVLLFFQYTFLPTTMWRLIICPRISCFWSGTFSLRWLRQLFAFGTFQRWTSGIFSFYSMPALFHFGNTTACGGLGVECLQPSLDFSGKLCVSSSSSGPSSSVQVSGRTCQQSTQTFDSGGTMLDGGSLASHHSQHVGRCSLAVSHHKRSCHGCFGRPGTQGSAISAFNPLEAQQHVLHRQGSLPWSVRWWWGQLEHLHQRSTSSAGKNGQVGVLDRVHQTMPSLPLN